MTTDSPQPNVVDAPRRTDFTVEFWALVVLTGVGSGLAAGLLMKLLSFVQHTVWRYHGGSFLDGVDRTANTTRVLVLVATGAVVAVVLPIMGRFKSGRPSELEATIWFRDGRLPTVQTIVKAIFSIVVVGLGASLGREAAPKQIGTLIGGLFAEARGLNASKRRLLAAIGAGAGIAAVYDVPFGGALFSLEVLLGSLALPLVAPAFLATLTATATVWLILPNEPTYHITTMPLTPSLVVFALVFAPVAGIASALFVKLIAGIAELKPKGLTIVPAAIVVFGVLGLLAIPYPQLLGNGKDAVQLALVDQIALPTLIALALLKPLVTAACLGTGAPGGLFTPTITFGALLGGACGHLWMMFVWPDAAAGTFALVGAAALLAATTKGPVSALVLMSELTRHVDGLLVPMLLAIAGATTVAHLIDARSTYTSRLGAAADLTEAAGGTTVSVATRYVEVLRAVLLNGDRVAVADEGGTIVGEITRGDLAAHSDRLRPLEIATAIDVLEAKGGTAVS